MSGHYVQPIVCVSVQYRGRETGPVFKLEAMGVEV